MQGNEIIDRNYHRSKTNAMYMKKTLLSISYFSVIFTLYSLFISLGKFDQVDMLSLEIYIFKKYAQNIKSWSGGIIVLN